jgi:hypothetical protein
MTLFVVDKYVIKPEKQDEFMALIKKMDEYRKANPETFKELKSWRLLSQWFGYTCMGMGEFDSLADIEKYGTKVSEDKVYAKMWQDFMLLTVPATYSVNIWNAVV